MDIISKVDEYLKQGKRFALLTIVESKGSTPRDINSKMIVFSDGDIEGSIGGGKTEFLAIKDALYCIRRQKSELKEYSLTKKEDLLCGGKMKVFIETFKPSKKLIIVGAGHIGLALYKFALILGFDIVVVDNRKEFANSRRFPKAEIRVGTPDIQLKKIKIDKNTYVAIATHGHAFDAVSLRAVVNSSAKYIGMIGSKSKIREVFKKMLKQGVSRTLLKKVHSPIGLDLGGGLPEEIALSILAEMQMEEYEAKRDLRFKKLV